jgi:hypothetical protein
VTAKKWKLVVNPLSGSTPLHQFEIEAGNWMGALRNARKELGEEGGLPSGASCAVTPEGVVTILDPEARRKFVLTPIVVTPAAAAPAARAPEAPKPAAEPERAVKPAKFRTIAYAPSQPLLPPTARAVPQPAGRGSIPPAAAAAAARSINPPPPGGAYAMPPQPSAAGALPICANPCSLAGCEVEREFGKGAARRFGHSHAGSRRYRRPETIGCQH